MTTTTPLRDYLKEILAIRDIFDDCEADDPNWNAIYDMADLAQDAVEEIDALRALVTEGAKCSSTQTPSS